MARGQRRSARERETPVACQSLREVRERLSVRERHAREQAVDPGNERGELGFETSEKRGVWSETAQRGRAASPAPTPFYAA
jgi:hypothetical protein